MSQQPPAFKAQSQASLPRWRKMPPAIFPPVLGAFGLAGAWARTPDAFGFTPAIGQMLLGAVTLLYLYLAGSYAAKVLKRPGVVVDELKVLPGRSGLAALAMSGMLLAAAAVPFSIALAKLLLVLSVAVHAIVLALFLKLFLTGPAEARIVTPVMHLTFVGFLVSPFAALPLGWTAFATAVFWLSLAAATVIWLGSLLQFIRKDVPAPLRPVLAIHLAPASLLGMVALLLGMGTLGLAFGIFALVLVAALLGRWRWLTESGFTPFWGAFTFPLAAFASLMMVLGKAHYGLIDGGLFRWIGGLALLAASVFIPWVLTKVVQMWLKGQLAAKTNAAVA